MEAMNGRYEEFGAPRWSGIVLALVVGFALVGPLAHTRPSAAHVPPGPARVTTHTAVWQGK